MLFRISLIVCTLVLILSGFSHGTSIIYSHWLPLYRVNLLNDGTWVTLEVSPRNFNMVESTTAEVFVNYSGLRNSYGRKSEFVMATDVEFADGLYIFHFGDGSVKRFTLSDTLEFLFYDELDSDISADFQIRNTIISTSSSPWVKLVETRRSIIVYLESEVLYFNKAAWIQLETGEVSRRKIGIDYGDEPHQIVILDGPPVFMDENWYVIVKKDRWFKSNCFLVELTINGSLPDRGRVIQSGRIYDLCLGENKVVFVEYLGEVDHLEKQLTSFDGINFDVISGIFE